MKQFVRCNVAADSKQNSSGRNRSVEYMMSRLTLSDARTGSAVSNTEPGCLSLQVSSSSLLWVFPCSSSGPDKFNNKWRSHCIWCAACRSHPSVCLLSESRRSFLCRRRTQLHNNTLATWRTQQQKRCVRVTAELSQSEGSSYLSYTDTVGPHRGAAGSAPGRRTVWCTNCLQDTKQTTTPALKLQTSDLHTLSSWKVDFFSL